MAYSAGFLCSKRVTAPLKYIFSCPWYVVSHFDLCYTYISVYLAADIIYSYICPIQTQLSKLLQLKQQRIAKLTKYNTEIQKMVSLNMTSSVKLTMNSSFCCSKQD